MARKIKDIKDKNTGLLVYPRTHLSAVVVDETTNLENLIGTNVGNRLNLLETTIKTDGSGEKYLSDNGTYQTLDLSGKLDIISDLETIRSGASAGATSIQALDLNNLAVSINGLINSINSNINGISSEITNAKRIAEAAQTKATNNESAILQCVAKLELNEAIAGKQDTLVSGTSIKTINGTSLLGSGDIEVGSSAIDTFQTRTGTTHGISSFAANTVFSCSSSDNTTSITISGFANPTPATRAAYYTIVFKTTSCTFTVPSTVMWVGGNAIEFDSSTAHTYEVNFMKIQLSEGVRYLATWNRY